MNKKVFNYYDYGLAIGAYSRMNFLFGMVVTVFTFLMHDIDQVQGPQVVLQRGPHPYRHWMVFVRNPIQLDFGMDVSVGVHKT